MPSHARAKAKKASWSLTITPLVSSVWAARILVMREAAGGTPRRSSSKAMASGSHSVKDAPKTSLRAFQATDGLTRGSRRTSTGDISASERGPKLLPKQLLHVHGKRGQNLHELH